MSGEVSNEVLIKLFGNVKTLGYEFSEEVCKTTGDNYYHLRFDRELCLTLLLKKFGESKLFLRKELPQNCMVYYFDLNTEFVSGDYSALNVEIEGKLITFGLRKGTVSEARRDPTLENIKKIDAETPRYSAQFEYVYFLPVHLYKYTSDKDFLAYFEMNKLVLKKEDFRMDTSI